MANTIPSWMNVKHPDVPPKKTVWWSIALALFLYLSCGVLGGINYDLDINTNLLQAMYADPHLSQIAFAWMTFIYIVFPWLTYITSIPINMLVVKLNFLAAKIMSPSAASFWSIYFPFIIGIPFQTGSLVTYFGTFTSLTFQSMCNFLAPFLIFIFLSKRKLEMAQSVLDELEFLDISAGIKKGSGDDDNDDFDYIYHLPHASESQIWYRDPFATPKPLVKKTMTSMQHLSKHSMHSIKELRSMLTPEEETVSLRTRGTRSGTKKKSSKGDDRNDVNLSIGSNLKSQASLGRNLTAGGGLLNRRQTMAATKNLGDGLEKVVHANDVVEDEMGDLVLVMKDIAVFRAMPDIIYLYVRANTVAIGSFVIMIAFILQVVYSSV